MNVNSSFVRVKWRESSVETSISIICIPNIDKLSIVSEKVINHYELWMYETV